MQICIEFASIRSAICPEASTLTHFFFGINGFCDSFALSFTTLHRKLRYPITYNHKSRKRAGGQLETRSSVRQSLL